MRSCLIGISVVLMIHTHTPAQTTESLLARIRAVGKEGKGNEDAIAALQQLTRQGPEVLEDVLRGFEGASPLAVNWLRGGFEAIADRTLKTGKPLPAVQLEAFVRETRQNAFARRLAYEWLLKVDPSAEQRLLPGMLDDPAGELRRDAVAQLIKAAQEQLEKNDKSAATAGFQKALTHARDRDQVQLVAGQLKKLDVDVDLTRHFGYITRWMVIGPFDNTANKGFYAPFPPEKGFDLKASYDGKKGKVQWKEHITKEKMGAVDFNKLIEHLLKGATAYAYTAVVSPTERAVELRATSNNAIRIYLNGKEVYFRDEYHHGTRMDQHVGKGTLKAGRNEILVKVCQNEQTDSWAELWSFQLRICDHLGGAVPVTVDIGGNP